MRGFHFVGGGNLNIDYELVAPGNRNHEIYGFEFIGLTSIFFSGPIRKRWKIIGLVGFGRGFCLFSTFTRFSIVKMLICGTTQSVRAGADSVWR